MQSFGYSALAYVLALAQKLDPSRSYSMILAKVVNLLKASRCNDIEIPLVIGSRCFTRYNDFDSKDTSFAGWYPYNNHFDYFPFSLYFLMKTCELLDDQQQCDNVPILTIPASYSDKMFLRYSNLRYDAVISAPGGYWTNDMSIPYVVAAERLTPCYGGEQFQSSIYRQHDSPLPYFERFRKSLGWRCRSMIFGQNMIVVSPLGALLRRYRFEESQIVIDDYVLSFFQFEHVYLALPDTAFDKFMARTARFKELCYSASGKIRKYSYGGSFHNQVVIKVAGDCQASV